MLSIGPLEAGKQHYYTQLARTDYYTEGGEPPGRWWGDAAKLLRLHGVVQPDELSWLTLGFTPDGKRALVRNPAGVKRRAGFDLTFSAPKSVSVAWSQADPEMRRAIEAAQQAAVERALGYLEKRATFTRRGRGGVHQVRGNLAVALFDHCTARAELNKTPDPQLHTHALVMNLCDGEDGRWGALDGSHLFQHKMTAGVLYRAELFRQLQERLQLVASRGERSCEISGVPTSVNRAFSKRRAAIEAKLAANGESSAVAAAKAARDTRKSKTVVNRTELLAEWKSQAQALGFSIDQVARRELERDPQAVLRSSAAKALAAITDTRSHFARHHLVRAIAELVEPAAIGIDAIERQVEKTLVELVPLAEQKGVKQYTTHAMLRLERELMTESKVLRARRHSVSNEQLGRAIEKISSARKLSDEQLRALHRITQGGSLELVSGLAGTGKTTMVKAARMAWEESGYKVIGAALAARAAQGLEASSGIKSASIHRTIHAIEKGRLRLDRKSVVVCDESSMVGTRLMQRLTNEVQKAHAKLVLIGDELQLGAIEAGSPFAALIGQFGCSRLENIQRQNEAWARKAAVDFSRGRIAEALSEYSDRGLVHVGRNRDQTLARLTADWKEAVRASGIEQALVLAGTRKEARQANASIQQARYAAGELGQDAVATEREVIFEGDRVRFRRNTEQVLNGQTGVVAGVTAETRVITVELENGRTVDIDLEAYGDVELGYAGTTHSAQGETVERCFVLCSESMQARDMTYVQASRATTETRFYVDRRTAGKDLEKLTRSMEREPERGLAIDLLPEAA